MESAQIMLVALAIDWAVGWPDALYRRIGHPVTWLGALIDRLDRAWNGGAAPRRAGVWVTALVTLAAMLPMGAALALLPPGPFGILLAALLSWPWIAARSLETHVAAVARPLEAGDLPGARRAVSAIVGRDPERLDGAGIARAALESLAENTSDGVTAPLFWGVLLGPVGLAGYKAVNTLDSMIGHKTPRYLDFGRAAARLDDWVNWPAARLTGGLYALVSRRGAAWRVMHRDARAHRSPNAGWPEAALAGALSVRLSGPRHYAEGSADEPWLNAGAPDPDGAALGQGLLLYRRVLLALALLLLALSAV